MRLAPLDAFVTLLVGACVVVAVWFGASGAAGGSPRSTGFDLALSVHENTDPLKPPGLPAGASVDPETGWLTGIDLAPDDGDTPLMWDVLAVGNESTSGADVPAAIRALEGKTVVMAGFQMALYRLRDMREFLLVGSHYTCCFGRAPGFGDQVTVVLKRRGPGMDATAAPVRVRGTFRIRPQHLYEDGTGPLIALFEIVEAEAVPYDG